MAETMAPSAWSTKWAVLDDDFEYFNHYVLFKQWRAVCALYEILLELPCLEGIRKRDLSSSLFITYLTIR